MTLKKGYKQLLAEAEHKAPGISLQDAQKSLQDPDTGFGEWRKAGLPAGPKPEKKK